MAPSTGSRGRRTSIVPVSIAAAASRPAADTARRNQSAAGTTNGKTNEVE